MLRYCRIVGMCAALVLVATFPAVRAESLFIVIPSTRIDERLLKKAEKVATELLTGWREGRFEHLPDDFSLDLIAALPPADQEKAYDALRVLFGHFESMTFAEALISPTMPGAVVFRFRGTFSGTRDKPEIRVAITDEGKIVNFAVKHWVDQFQ